MPTRDQTHSRPSWTHKFRMSITLRRWTSSQVLTGYFPADRKDHPPRITTIGVSLQTCSDTHPRTGSICLRVDPTCTEPRWYDGISRLTNSAAISLNLEAPLTPVACHRGLDKVYPMNLRIWVPYPHSEPMNHPSMLFSRRTSCTLLFLASLSPPLTHTPSQEFRKMRHNMNLSTSEGVASMAAHVAARTAMAV